ncbi:hypothetical protein QR680_015586 [Steinernema hermaphroditum]|uniref:Uncharacterized protein n=1 Tax=Steinernema hermaphroditum TaxID=289476 RepID=A0AA39LL09_9BILA|nr:hypothetical protein QR680_015586 [Steinernema hermaphroditum]
MDLFFFHHDDYERLYNCTGVDPANSGSPSFGLGLAYILVGIPLEILYIPCMIVLLKRELRQHSCYKLMFLLGLFDIVTIFIIAPITGYLTMEGAVYCTHSTLIYICGIAVMFLWCGTCMTSVTLGINRIFDLWSPSWTQTLFGGRRTYWWFAPPFIYGFGMAWVTHTFCYSTLGYGWFNNPYIGMNRTGVDPLQYTSVSHAFNNVSVIILLTAIYITLAISVYIKCRGVNSVRISKIQKQLIFQSCLVCFFVIFADAVYVYAQYLPVPAWLVIAGHWGWIACHGSAVVIYLSCNETIRKGLFELFRVTTMRAQLSATVTAHHQSATIS